MHLAHLDIPAAYATYTRQAISVALESRPDIFDDEQVVALNDMSRLLGQARRREMETRPAP